MNLQDARVQGKTAVHVAASALPNKQNEVVEPWVAHAALDLIDRRSQARATSDKSDEKRLLKEVRRA
eukprot:9292880-Pyramimonas_sp.AAC.1